MGSAPNRSWRPIGLVIAAGLLLAPAFQTPGFAAQPEEPHCGMRPPSAERALYAGYGACWLRKIGKKPLWRGLARPDYRQQIRFTFAEGHMRYVRVIDFVELSTGEGRVDTVTITSPDGRAMKTSGRARRAVSRDAVQKLNRLAEASGAWEFAVGSWDGEEMFHHCQILDMERIDRAGYRSSTVNISCNRPSRLMPFVEHLAGLAGVKEERGLY